MCQRSKPYLAQLPGPGRERVGLGGQRPHGTQVNHIAAELGAKDLLNVGADLHVAAAARRSQVVHARHLAREAHTPSAVDAP